MENLCSNHRSKDVGGPMPNNVIQKRLLYFAYALMVVGIIVKVAGY